MINQTASILTKTGLTWFVPFLRLAAGEDPRQQMKEILLQIGVPVLAFALFLAVWNVLAAGVHTSLGTIPGPMQVVAEAKGLVEEHYSEREKAAGFYERQEARVAAALAEDPTAEVTMRTWTGKPTYLDQIITSLYTVFTGFALATLVAVPLGILCGLSPTFQLAINPLIQIFRPVSPLAWLPIVTLVVSAVYVTSDGAWFEKSFITSAVTVTLCSLWPTLINTALGVSSIDKDLINVAKVLRLPWYTKVVKIVLPSSLELIFTGLDGADCRRNAGAEPRPWQVRLGRISERQFTLARPHHGRRIHHRFRRLPVGSGDVHAAANGQFQRAITLKNPAITTRTHHV